MVRIALTAIALLAALPAAAQDTNPCGTGKVACRHIEDLRLEAADGTVTMVPAGLDFPWVADGNIILVPGDSITVKLVPNDGELEPVLVRAGPASASTKPGPGEIRFTIAPSDRGTQRMTAESNYPGMIDYGALIVLATTGPKRTSVCTLQSGLAVHEVWTGPIMQIALMHFVPAKEVGCKLLDWGEGPQLVK